MSRSPAVDLSDCCESLNSIKIVDRKKGVEKLQLLLRNQKYLELLDSNTNKETGVSWIKIFLGLHHSLLKLGERFAFEKENKGKLTPTTDSGIKTCCGLLVLVVEKANTGLFQQPFEATRSIGSLVVSNCRNRPYIGKPSLSSSQVFSCVLQVLEESEDPIRISVIGETYVSILSLCLSKKCYWGEISFQTWKDLLAVCICLLEQPMSDRTKGTIIAIMNTIILEGGRLSPLILKSKNLLPKFPDILKHLAASRYPLVEVNCLHLLYTMCTQFDKEFHLSVSKFMEDILPSVVRLNDNRNSDVLFKELLSELLLLIASARLTDDGWSNEASSILSFIENEISIISRHGLLLPRPPKIIILAVKLLRKLSHKPDEDHCDPEAKRRKVNTNVGRILDNLSLEKQHFWPWLCYLDYLLETSPGLVVENDFTLLLRFFSDHLPQTNEPISLQYMAKSSVRLLIIVKDKSMLKSLLSEFLSILWSTIHRCSSVSSLIDIGLSLASDLLPDWCLPEPARALIVLFSERKIPITKTALATLSRLLSAGLVTNSNSKISLLHWSLSGDIYSTETIFGLISRSKLPIKSTPMHLDIGLTDSEKFHLVASLGITPTPDLVNDSGISLKNIIEDKIVSEEFCTILLIKLSEINSLQNLLCLNSVLLSLLSYFNKYNISIKDKLEEVLKRTLPGLIIRLSDSFIELQTNPSEDHMAIVEVSTDLFSKLSVIGDDILTAEVSERLVKNILKVITERHQASAGILEKPSYIQLKQSIETNNPPELSILSALLTLNQSHSEEQKIKTYLNLLDFCNNNVNLSTNSGFDLTTLIIKDILSSKICTEVVYRTVVSLAMKLCKKWFLMHNEAIVIVDIIKESIGPIFKIDENGDLRSQIFIIISKFSKHISSKKYGPEMIVKYVSLLAYILEFEPEAEHVINVLGTNESILLCLIDYLNNTFHEVRIRTSELIPSIFNTDDCSPQRMELLSEAFLKTLEAVEKLFVVKGDKNPHDVKEEGNNRSLCALRILLGLVCSSSHWRRKSLYVLFTTIVTKNINPDLFVKIHQYLKQNLLIENTISFFEQNLDYILWEWYQDNKNFDNFPFHFMNYESKLSFFNEYKTLIIPIYIENLNVESVHDFANELSLSDSDLAESCYPEIMAALLPNLGGSGMSKAPQIYECIQQFLDGDTIKALLSSELQKVLLSVYVKLSDMNYFSELCDSSVLPLPTRISQNINICGVTTSLQYMQKTSPNPEESLLVLLSIGYPNHIQYLMHNLIENVTVASTPENRALCFYQYITVCHTLAPELHKLGDMAGFIIRHTVQSLIHLIRTDVSLPALNFLHRFLCCCLPSFAKYINYLVVYILPIINLVCQESSPGDLSTSANKIKELLEITWKHVLSRVKSIRSLQGISDSLKEEFDNFLERQSVDLDSLSRLSSQLSERKDELCMLYEDVRKTRCFADDCTRSPIHKVIAKLAHVATSADANIKLYAGRCLGQIGPRNLYTLALQPESSESISTLEEKTICLLLPLIFNKDPELSGYAASAMTELLLSKEGYNVYDQMEEIEKTFLTPFLPGFKKLNVIHKLKSYTRLFTIEKLFWATNLKEIGTEVKGWSVWTAGDHEEWVKHLVSSLLSAFSDGYLLLLAPIAAKLVNVSEELLPYLTNLLVEQSDEIPFGLQIVKKNVNLFFKKHFELRDILHHSEEETSIYSNRKSVQCMLSIVNFLRLKTFKMGRGERLEENEKLDINYLHVAHAAQFCRAYFTSSLYAELWIDSVLINLVDLINDELELRPLDLICKNKPEEGQVLVNLLWENYKEIGDRDSLEGCARLLLGDPTSRLRYFREMGLWQELIAEAEIGNNQEALSQGLVMSGRYVSASHFNDFGWESAWRLANWDKEPPQPGKEDFLSLHYCALRSALHDKDKQGALNCLESGRDIVLASLAHASLEVAASVYSPLAKLQLITELESLCLDNRFDSDIPDADWVYTEPILWQRGIFNNEAQHWISTAKISRNNSANLIAQRCLQNIKKEGIHYNLLGEIKLEEAEIHWESGNLETAKFLLKSLLERVNDNGLKVKCLLRYGTWMSETKSQGPKDIIEQYFEEASRISNNSEERLAAAECVAKFADCEFQRIDRYINSSEYEVKVTQMAELRKNLEVLQSCSTGRTMDERKSAKIHENNVEMDRTEIKNVHKEHCAFLKLAVREYLLCLGHGSTENDKVFRFVSLWLSNSEKKGLKEEVDNGIKYVPSYRFIPVFPQLSSRISPEETHFSKTLFSLLFRCSKDHPHHCLWNLLALVNAERDEPKTENAPAQPRMVGATKLLKELHRYQETANIVKSMNELAVAYINFANYEFDKNIRPAEKKIPKGEPLRYLKDLSHVSCATVTMPVSKTGDYSNVIGVIKFEETFHLLWGVNQPKRVRCICTDGKIRDQLVKGKDDPRQDALMQQVFSVLNTLLEADKNTSRRKLNVRTYKVIPLSRKSGLIEWCSGTDPIANYLQEAHNRHRPDDLSQLECRKKLESVAGKDLKDKLKVYLGICARFKPVMRYFFLEKFLTPSSWYERRLAYTKSVATNSMIGYLMGIGDRHVANILIDNSTAELVHIDFGISFELGRILPTPETVPFRLTRDIEDGMGITGVDGVFKRSCEETLRVLRKKSEPVITTLEVLLYDPLYSWSVNPRSDQSQQSIPDISVAETNKLAERFLQRLKLKLAGRDEGGSTYSIESQVRNLIQEAKDPKNLCRLFCGWRAYL